MALYDCPPSVAGEGDTTGRGILLPLVKCSTELTSVNKELWNKTR